MNVTVLAGHTILVVEDEAIIALDLETALSQAGAQVVCANTGNADEIVSGQAPSAAVLGLRPAASEHRALARMLRDRRIPFLFYSTHNPEDVTTMRGAPVVFKPARAEDIVGAVALLIRDA